MIYAPSVTQRFKGISSFGSSGSHREIYQGKEFLTTSNCARAVVLENLVRSGSAIIRRTITDRYGRPEAIAYPNPIFRAVISSRSYPADMRATLQAFVEGLQADGNLRACAERDGITIESIEEEIELIYDAERSDFDA